MARDFSQVLFTDRNGFSVVLEPQAAACITCDTANNLVAKAQCQSWTKRFLQHVYVHPTQDVKLACPQAAAA